jgi:hypothetical protein
MEAPPSPVRRGAVALAATLAAAVAVPGVAEAEQVKGTVVAKDAQRGTLVTAAPSGAVTTLRTKGIRRYRIGQRVAAPATAQPDGTFAATGTVKRRAGVARSARVRATVVKRAGGRYVLSAGSSTFAIAHRGRAGTAAATRGPRAGDVIVAAVRLTAGRATGTQVKTVGQAAMLEVEGILLGADGGVLRIAVEKRGEVAVTVPAGHEIALAAGDEVEAIVSVEDDGTFTLVALDGDGDEQDDHGLDLDEDSVEVEGVVTALSEASLTVAAGTAASVTCAVPAGTSLAGFSVGDDVEAECRLLDDGGFELVRLESADHEIEVEWPETETESEGDDRPQAEEDALRAPEPSRERSRARDGESDR